MERLAVAALLTLTCLVTAACPGPASTPPRAADSPAAHTTPQAVPADRQQLENVIRDIVAEVLGVPPNEVDVGAPLMKQKVPADELDAVEIVMLIEERFGVEIPDADLSTPDGELREDLSVRMLAGIVAGKKPRK
ncbi:MAG TPA: phosphopantetheine-binding protein [Pyrinomonadaceae bacterium]